MHKVAFLQFRINYSANGAPFYRQVAQPLKDLFAGTGFVRWTMARGWANGPHYLLTFDSACPRYRDHWLDAIDARIAQFLVACPSADVDPLKQRQLQRQLNQVEQAGIDPEQIEENNTVARRSVQVAELARKYESEAQWLSVFDNEAALRPLVTARWLEGEQHEEFAAALMILLACVYTPVASGDPERPWYDGFLSYHSNFVFWRHSLPAAAGAQVTERFEQAYAQSHGGYAALLARLETDLAPACRHGVTPDMAHLLAHRWRAVQALAQSRQIHARSPFAPQRLAPKDAVSDFHREFFYNEDGSANMFSTEFVAYRWLLNIVYRTLPLLNIAPLARQRLNYALDRLHTEQPEAVGRIRAALLARMASAGALA